MSTIALTSTNAAIERFIQLVQQGYESWIEAGRIVCEQTDNDPSFPEKVTKKHPEISEDVIYAFEQIGRRKLHPKLLMSNKPGPRRLRSMPYELQERFIEEPVNVLVENNGKWEELRVSVFNLTPLQARQVFNGNTIRPAAAQRAFIESEKLSNATEANLAEVPYRITNGALVVLQPCKLDRKQLSQILANMM